MDAGFLMHGDPVDARFRERGDELAGTFDRRNVHRFPMIFALISTRLAYSLTVLALNRKTSAVLHMVSSRFPLSVGFAVLLPVRILFSPQHFVLTLRNFDQISTTHHIILAAPDGSEHSETEIRLVSLDKDVLTYLATLEKAKWGADVPNSPVILLQTGPPEPFTVFLVPTGKWSDGTPAPMPK
jgi:hypothetical protein